MDLIRFFRDFGKKLQKDNIGAYASGISFFFLMSFVPMLIMIGTAVKMTPLPEDEVVRVSLLYCPDFLDPFFEVIITQIFSSNLSLLPIAVVTLLWAAGKGMWGLMMGLNTANGVTETRNAAWVRILAIIYSVLMLFAILVAFAIIAIGENFVVFIKVHIPQIVGLVSRISDLRFVILIIFLAFGFALIYTIVPNTKLNLIKQLPGAIFSALLWTAFSYFFSLYVDYYQGFNIYGSLSSLVIAMLWMYTCMYILLIGANINVYFVEIIKVFRNPRKNREVK